MRRTLTWLCGWLALASCAKEQGQSQLDAHVTLDQFQRANQIISRIDYLPFGYTADGCFGRSFYMSMELAAESIPSSAQAVNICAPDEPDLYTNPDNLLRLADGTAWSWHVAPLVVLDGREYVIDPSMSAVPMRRVDWMAYMSHQLPVNFNLVTATDPSKGRLQDAQCDQDLGYELMVGSFDEMAAFEAPNVASHCSYMHAYISRLTSVSEATKAAMQVRLIERTKYLVSRLKELQKLEEFSQIDYDVACRFSVDR